MSDPRLGDFFVVNTGDNLAARTIRFVTRSDVNHAGLYLGGGQIIEAQPSGACISPVTNYPNAIWSKLDIDPAVRTRIVDHALTLKGTPYNWVDVVCIGLVKLFGWNVPEPVRARLRTPNSLFCSQLVDTAYLYAGVHLFSDGRLPGAVSPGDLRAFTEGKP